MSPPCISEGKVGMVSDNVILRGKGGPTHSYSSLIPQHLRNMVKYTVIQVHKVLERMKRQ